MVVDTSALVCIIRNEPEAREFLGLVQRDPVRLISIVSMVEAGIVLENRFGVAGSRELENVIAGLRLQIEPVTAEQGRMALLAFWRYGRGIHPAGLNFGDCFPYALAKVTGERLLYQGNDFGQTDVALMR